MDFDLQTTTRFYWRVRVTQGTAVSDWSTSRNFTTPVMGYSRAGELYDPLVYSGTVGIPVVEALRAFHRGIYEAAVTLLLQSRVDLWQIGGSHAQRDVVDWTLAEAALRAGQRDVALALAHERLATRPRSAPNRRFLRRAEGLAAGAA